MAGPVGIVPEVNPVRAPVAPAASMVKPPAAGAVNVVTVYVKGVAEGDPVLQPFAFVALSKTIVVAPTARMAPPVVQMIFPDEEAGTLQAAATLVFVTSQV